MYHIVNIQQGMYNGYFYKVDEYSDDPIKYYQVFVELPPGVTLKQLRQFPEIESLLPKTEIDEYVVGKWVTTTTTIDLKCLSWSNTDIEDTSTLVDVIFKLIELFDTLPKGHKNV